jgi:RHS repeat-associated protein
VTGPQEATQYDYDPAGNRNLKTVTRGQSVSRTQYVYDANNRLTSESGPAGAKSYDKNGNLLADGPTAYHYDWLDRLTQVDLSPQRHVAYQYDGDGLLATRMLDGVTTRYHYDRNQLYLETDGADAVLARTLNAGGPLVRQVANQPKANYIFDAHGDVRKLTDPTGQVKATYAYDAFGNPTAQTGELSNPLRYAGYQWDADAGLYYLRSRFYQPADGRFLTEDTWKGPLDKPWTQNLYTYAGGNPITYVDPTGHGVEEGCFGKNVTSCSGSGSGISTTAEGEIGEDPEMGKRQKVPTVTVRTA